MTFLSPKQPPTPHLEPPRSSVRITLFHIIACGAKPRNRETPMALILQALGVGRMPCGKLVFALWMGMERRCPGDAQRRHTGKGVGAVGMEKGLHSGQVVDMGTGNVPMENQGDFAKEAFG
jgi:hypothetical protein